MNIITIFLAIICVWPAGDGLPKVAIAPAPSLEVCEADVAAVKTKLEQDPGVRFVSTDCLQFSRGEKS